MKPYIDVPKTIALLAKEYAPISGVYFAAMRAAGYDDAAIVAECHEYGQDATDRAAFPAMLQERTKGLANAKLFAAAPELLAACLKMMEWMQARGHDYADFAAPYDAVQAAVDKAQ